MVIKKVKSSPTKKENANTRKPKILKKMSVLLKTHIHQMRSTYDDLHNLKLIHEEEPAESSDNKAVTGIMNTNEIERVQEKLSQTRRPLPACFSHKALLNSQLALRPDLKESWRRNVLLQIFQCGEKATVGF